jgi:hypothetical protein
MSEPDIKLIEDRSGGDEWRGEWRVEYFDEDGGCYVTIFAGPEAQERAQDYSTALKAGTLRPRTSGPPVESRA